MDAKSFSEAYPREARPNHFGSNLDTQTLEKAAELSGNFGGYLHDLITDEFSQDVSKERIVNTLKSNYAQLVFKELPKVEKALLLSPEKDDTHALGLINYHYLNAAMLPMWSVLVKGEKMPFKERLEMIRASQDFLAYDGAEQYVWRDRLTGPKSDYRYFEDDMASIRSMVEGRLHERDTAIVLLDIAAKHNLTVLPAPPQFEDNDVRFNVDFLVMQPSTNRVVGVQVKSQVRKHDREIYNPDFVVLVDGSIDLGNSRVMRTSSKRTKMNGVSWAGTISAHAMTLLRVHGPQSSMLLRAYPKPAVLKAMTDAKIRLGDIRVDRQSLEATLTPRILEKL